MESFSQTSSKMKPLSKKEYKRMKRVALDLILKLQKKKQFVRADSFDALVRQVNDDIQSKTLMKLVENLDAVLDTGVKTNAKWVRTGDAGELRYKHMVKEEPVKKRAEISEEEKEKRKQEGLKKKKFADELLDVTMRYYKRTREHFKACRNDDLVKIKRKYLQASMTTASIKMEFGDMYTDPVAFAQASRNDTFIYQMEKFTASGIDAIRIIHVSKAKVDLFADVDANDIENFKNMTVCSKGTPLKRKNMGSFDGLFDVEQDMENACVYNALLKIYVPAFAKAYKKRKLTFESLYELFNDRPYEQGAPTGVSVKTMTKFFETYRLRYKIFDQDLKLIYEFTPESCDNNIRPRCAYFMRHNSHIQVIEDMIQHLGQKEMEDGEEKTPGQNYFIRSTETEDQTFCAELNDILDKIGDKKGDLKVYYPGNLKDVLHRLIFESKYLPIASFNNMGNVLSLTIYFDELRVLIVNPIQATGHVILEEDCACTEEYFAKYKKHEDSLYNSLVNRTLLSSYHPTFITGLQSYRRTAMIGKFRSFEGEIFEVDRSKAYTSCLLSMDYLPVFNTFDTFRVWDGKIEDYCIYYVKAKQNKDLILLDKQYNLVSGFVLKQCVKRVDVLAFAKPSKLVENQTKSVIKNIYESDLQEVHKKLLCNIVIGKIEKMKNCISKTWIYTCLKDASVKAREIDGEILTVTLKGNEFEAHTLDIFEYKEYNVNMEQSEYVGIQNDLRQVYVVKKNVESSLVNGFLPIKFFIYDLNRLEMHKLYKDCVKKGLRVVAIKTDALFVQGDMEEIGFDGSKFENIGRVKVSKASRDSVPTIQLFFQPNEDALEYFQDVTPNMIEIEDEWKMDEFVEVFDRVNVMVLADAAGSGKTSVIKRYFKGKEALIVTPNNMQACEFIREGFDSCTTYQALGIRLNDSGEESSVKMRVEDYEFILFDEIFSYDLKMLAKVADYMEAHPEKRFFATGDPCQNQPIQSLTTDFDSYYYRILNRMFPNQIVLKECKRMKREDGEKIKRIKSVLMKTDDRATWIRVFRDEGIRVVEVVPDKLSELDGLSVCYTRNMVKKINMAVHERVSQSKKGFMIRGVKYWKGMDLVCTVTTRLKNVNLYCNYTYQLESISDTEIVLLDPLTNDEISIPRKIKQKDSLDMFQFSYAGTGHSTQGLTFDTNINVFGIMHPYADWRWVYTAATRGRDLKKLTIFVAPGAEEFQRVLRKSVAERIQGYKDQDLKAGREYEESDFLTADSVMGSLKACNFSCTYCRRELSLSGDLSVWTMDRIDNKLAHIRSNCVVACLSCNCSKK